MSLTLTAHAASRTSSLDRGDKLTGFFRKPFFGSLVDFPGAQCRLKNERTGEAMVPAHTGVPMTITCTSASRAPATARATAAVCPDLE